MPLPTFSIVLYLCLPYRSISLSVCLSIYLSIIWATKPFDAKCFPNHVLQCLKFMVASTILRLHALHYCCQFRVLDSFLKFILLCYKKQVFLFLNKCLEFYSRVSWIHTHTHTHTHTPQTPYFEKCPQNH